MNSIAPTSSFLPINGSPVIDPLDGALGAIWTSGTAVRRNSGKNETTQNLQQSRSVRGADSMEEDGLRGAPSSHQRLHGASHTTQLAL